MWRNMLRVLFNYSKTSALSTMDIPQDGRAVATAASGRDDVLLSNFKVVVDQGKVNEEKKPMIHFSFFPLELDR